MSTSSQECSELSGEVRDLEAKFREADFQGVILAGKSLESRFLDADWDDVLALKILLYKSGRARSLGDPVAEREAERRKSELEAHGLNSERILAFKKSEG